MADDAKRLGVISLLVVGSLLAAPASAETWVKVTGSDSLRELVSGATATIQIDKDTSGC